MNSDDMKSKFSQISLHKSNGKLFANGLIWRKNSFIGYININSDVLHLEHFDHSRPNLVLLYKESSVKKIIVKANSNGDEQSFYKTRQAGPFFIPPNLPLVNKHCAVSLVAEREFLQYFGSDNQLVAAEMIMNINIANQFFVNTDFNDDGSEDNVGIRPFHVTILESSDIRSMYLLYESQSVALLYHTAAFLNMQEACLEIFFLNRNLTHRKTVSHGISFQAKSDKVNGICARPMHQTLRYPTGVIKSGLFQMNKIIVTITSRHGNKTRTQLATTIAHEIGHSFGASHDDVDLSDNNLMRSNMKLGHRTREMYFTDFNKVQISNILEIQGGCFLNNSAPVCGNGIKEGDEECDCGDIRYCSIVDNCCVPAGSEFECQLKPDAQCDHGDVCCDDECNYTSITTHKMCNYECYEDSYCDGTTSNCPSSLPKMKNVPCHDCFAKPCACDGDGYCTPIIILNNPISGNFSNF